MRRLLASAPDGGSSGTACQEYDGFAGPSAEAAGGSSLGSLEIVHRTATSRLDFGPRLHCPRACVAFAAQWLRHHDRPVETFLLFVLPVLRLLKLLRYFESFRTLFFRGDVCLGTWETQGIPSGIPAGVLGVLSYLPWIPPAWRIL